jgi:carboxyl-terminal processing protease
MILRRALAAAALAAAIFVPTASAEPSFDEALRVLQDKSIYRGPPERVDALKRAAIQSAVRRLDPYAEYVPPGGASEFDDTPRIPSALGFELIEADGQRYLVPFSAGPLTDLGYDDVVRLVAVDGKPVAGIATPALLQSLRDRRQVRLDIQRLKAGSAVQSVDIVARPLRIDSVETVQAGDTTVIRIREFRSLETRSSLMRALKALPKRQSLAVLDLRFNRGGDLVAAIEAASLFVAEGKRLAAFEDAKGVKREFFAVADGFKFNGRIALLVSGNTASAAETFIRAIAAYRKATIVGAKTHGKCDSQAQFPLSDGAVLIVTAFRVLDPSLRYCAGAGIGPAVALKGSDLMDVHVALAKLGVGAQTPR